VQAAGGLCRQVPADAAASAPLVETAVSSKKTSRAGCSRMTSPSTPARPHRPAQRQCLAGLIALEKMGSFCQDRDIWSCFVSCKNGATR
jgi:hypothetical protein